VTIAGRRAEVLEEAAAEIGACMGEGGEAGWMAGDVRDPDDAQRLVQGVLDRHGRLDLLVNNAGGQYFTPAEMIAAKGWSAVWRLNVGGTLNMSEAAFELSFGPAREGTIVNITLSPHHGMPGMARSGAARARALACTSAPVRSISGAPSLATSTTVIGAGVATATISQISAERANPASAPTSNQKAWAGPKWRITPKASRKTPADAEASTIRATSMVRCKRWRERQRSQAARCCT